MFCSLYLHTICSYMDFTTCWNYVCWSYARSSERHRWCCTYFLFWQVISVNVDFRVKLLSMNTYVQRLEFLIHTLTTHIHFVLSLRVLLNKTKHNIWSANISISMQRQTYFNTDCVLIHNFITFCYWHTSVQVVHFFAATYLNRLVFSSI